MKAMSCLVLAACVAGEPKVESPARAADVVPASADARPPTPALPVAVSTAAPDWAKLGARFEQRGGKRVAVAAAAVELQNPQLARDAAANRARSALLRLLHEKGPGEPVAGTLHGARIVKSETFEKGVAVEVEVDAP